MRKFENNILLFSVMLCWASAYVFIKGLPDDLSNFGYLALMNSIAALLLLLMFGKRVVSAKKKTFLHSLVLAVLMTIVLLCEKEGIERLAPASASILTSLDLVFVPLFMLLLRRFPTRAQIIGIVFILSGVFISNGVTLKDFPLTGSLFMLGDCLCMSLYTVVSNRFCQEDDPIVLAVVQLAFMGLIAMIAWNIESPWMILRLEYTRRFLSSLFILAIFSKAFAYIMLMYGEKYGDPIDVVLIFALEPVVTLILSVVIPERFGGVEETFTMTALIGAVFIMIGSSIANLDWQLIADRIQSRRKRDGTA
ncbi:MAG: DMT family transporter [Lachnospiraceae bacterium]|nr:DMT family transporter [Lachnospiraceae bacterium]